MGMHSGWHYINRIFIRRGTASQFGATICSDVYLMHSSTNGHMCGAVFRIRNTRNSGNIRWRPAMTMTGWAGWGERSSVSVNGQSTWQTSSTWEWQGTLNLDIPSNSSSNRVSTVIFMVGSSHPWNGPSERGTILMFRNDALRLPNGLEYVDDFDTRGSTSWKV